LSCAENGPEDRKEINVLSKELRESESQRGTPGVVNIEELRRFVRFRCVLTWILHEEILTAEISMSSQQSLLMAKAKYIKYRSLFIFLLCFFEFLVNFHSSRSFQHQFDLPCHHHFLPPLLLLDFHQMHCYCCWCRHD